jgi:hypothetical protein
MFDPIMQLKEMVLALLNESDVLLSDDSVEQIVHQVQCIKINRHSQLKSSQQFCFQIRLPPKYR